MPLASSKSRRHAPPGAEKGPNAYTRAANLATQVLIEWVLASEVEPATWVPTFELLRKEGYPSFPWRQFVLLDIVDSRCHLCSLRVRFCIACDGIPSNNATGAESEDVMYICPRSRPRPNPDNNMGYEKAVIECIKKSRAWSDYVIAIWHIICDREEPAHEREERERLQAARTKRIAFMRSRMSYTERTQREKEAGERAIEIAAAARNKTPEKEEEDKLARRSSVYSVIGWFKRT